MAITVRRTEPADVEALVKIYGNESAFRQTLQLPYPSYQSWKQKIENTPEHVYGFVAEIDGEVVGNLGLNVEQRARRRHVASIGMAVSETHSGCGVGSALLAAAIDLAESWLGVTRLELTVFVDNERAISLYKRHGFNVEGEAQGFALRDGAFVNAYYMARLLHRTATEKAPDAKIRQQQ